MAEYTLPAPGFDSYLRDILPDDQAMAAGALSIAFRQVKNITKVQPDEFAKIVYSIEGLQNITNSQGKSLILPDPGNPATSYSASGGVPVDQKAALKALNKQALGSGPYGTYTMSNYYGAMSGLIYAWENIFNGIANLENEKLGAIYKSLYLAVTWQQALVQWDGANFHFISRGGGYGLDGVMPTATVGGFPATVFVGEDPLDIATYGRIVDIYYQGPAGPVVISPPVGYTYYTLERTIIQDLINQANAEIANIYNNAANNATVRLLNAYWDLTGKALKMEQRARYLAIPPVPVPYDNRLADKPTVFSTFVDELPGWATETAPHMTVQTLEHIANYETLGGQSMVALMRAARNSERLSGMGTVTPSVPDSLPPEISKTLLSSGTVPTATPDGIPSPCEPGVFYTIPSTAKTGPNSYYLDGQIYYVNTVIEGDIMPILDCVANPRVNPVVTQGPGTPGFPDKATNKEINPFVVNPALTTNPNLNRDFIGSTLRSGYYNVDEAIKTVCAQNCDCWLK